MATIDELTHAAVLSRDMNIPVSLFGQNLRITLGQIIDISTAHPEDVRVQYSTDGNSWHEGLESTDLWMRLSTDGGKTWGERIRINATDGQPGRDGATYYTWIKYSDIPSPAVPSDIYDVPTDSTAYIGLAFNMPTPEESNNPALYHWSRIRGTDGNSLTDVGEYYAVGNSATQPPATGMFVQVPPDDMPKMTKERPYLWNYERTYFSDGTDKKTEPSLIGTLGADGVGIQSVTNYYLASKRASGVTTSDTADEKWTTSEKEASDRFGEEYPYLWNYEAITYTNLRVQATEPHIIGHWGSIITIVNTSNTFAITDNATQPADKDFTYSTLQSAVTASVAQSKPFIWTKTITSYSDGSFVTGYNVSRLGTDGSGGEIIPGTSSYLHIAYADHVWQMPPQSGYDVDGFSTTFDSTKAYIGICVTDTPEDPENPLSYEWSKYIGDGVKIEQTSVRYAATHTAQQPPDEAFTSTTIEGLGNVMGDYIWTRTYVEYTDGTFITTYSVSRIGTDGENGLPGGKGEDGRTSYIHYAYASNLTKNPPTAASQVEGFSTSPFEGAAYFGVYTDFELSDSTDPLKYKWSKFGYTPKDLQNVKDSVMEEMEEATLPSLSVYPATLVLADNSTYAVTIRSNNENKKITAIAVSLPASSRGRLNVTNKPIATGGSTVVVLAVTTTDIQSISAADTIGIDVTCAGEGIRVDIPYAIERKFSVNARNELEMNGSKLSDSLKGADGANGKSIQASWNATLGQITFTPVDSATSIIIDDLASKSTLDGVITRVATVETGLGDKVGSFEFSSTVTGIYTDVGSLLEKKLDTTDFTLEKIKGKITYDDERITGKPTIPRLVSDLQDGPTWTAQIAQKVSSTEFAQTLAELSVNVGNELGKKVGLTNIGTNIDNITFSGFTDKNGVEYIRMTACEGEMCKSIIVQQAYSATRLDNTIKIWGQDFDGTSDVDGDITIGGSLNVVNSYPSYSDGELKITYVNMAVAGSNISGHGAGVICFDERTGPRPFITALVNGYIASDLFINPGGGTVIFGRNTIPMVSAGTAIYANGSIVATGAVTQNASDIRLKTDISGTDCLTSIRSLGDVKTYRYLPEVLESNPDADTSVRHTGLIYQQAVNAGIPGFAGTNEKGYGYLNYLSPDLIATIIGAVQETDREVQMLRTEVLSLRRENAEIRGEIDELRELLSQLQKEREV